MALSDTFDIEAIEPNILSRMRSVNYDSEVASHHSPNRIQREMLGRLLLNHIAGGYVDEIWCHVIHNLNICSRDLSVS